VHQFTLLHGRKSKEEGPDVSSLERNCKIARKSKSLAKGKKKPSFQRWRHRGPPRNSDRMVGQDGTDDGVSNKNNPLPARVRCQGGGEGRRSQGEKAHGGEDLMCREGAVRGSPGQGPVG